MLNQSAEYLQSVVNILNQIDDFDPREFVGVKVETLLVDEELIEIPKALQEYLNFLGKKRPIGNLGSFEEIMVVNSTPNYRSLYPIPENSFFLALSEGSHCICLEKDGPNPVTNFYPELSEGSFEQEVIRYSTFTNFLEEYYKEQGSGWQRMIARKPGSQKSINLFKMIVLDLCSWIEERQTRLKKNQENSVRSKVFESLKNRAWEIYDKRLGFYSIPIDPEWKEFVNRWIDFSGYFSHLSKNDKDELFDFEQKIRFVFEDLVQ